MNIELRLVMIILYSAAAARGPVASRDPGTARAVQAHDAGGRPAWITR